MTKESQVSEMLFLQPQIIIIVFGCLTLYEMIDNNKYKGGIYMVFEYMDHDLTGLADRPGLRFTIPQIKVFPRLYSFLIVYKSH